MKGCSAHETYRKGCSKCAEVQPAPAPQPGMAAFVALADKAADNAFEVIAQLRAHISDLTRRLAEAEAELAEVRSRNSMLAVQRADAVHLAKASPTQAYQRIQQFKERAEAAERELEELKRSTK